MWLFFLSKPWSSRATSGLMCFMKYKGLYTCFICKSRDRPFVIFFIKSSKPRKTITTSDWALLSNEGHERRQWKFIWKSAMFQTRPLSRSGNLQSAHFTFGEDQSRQQDRFRQECNFKNCKWGVMAEQPSFSRMIKLPRIMKMDPLSLLKCRT